MKIKKNTKKVNKPLLIVLTLALLGGGAFFVYTLLIKPQFNKSEDTSNNTGTSVSKNQESETSKDTSEEKTTPSNSDTPKTPSVTTDSKKKEVQVVSSADQSSETIYIRGGINYPVTGGTCYVQLSGPSGKSIRKDSIVLQNPASTDCKTIVIPVSELSPGKWTFTLHYTSDEFEGKSSEATFSI